MITGYCQPAVPQKPEHIIRQIRDAEKQQYPEKNTGKYQQPDGNMVMSECQPAVEQEKYEPGGCKGGEYSSVGEIAEKNHQE